MKYFLATFEILDGEHEHTGAVIFEAETAAAASAMADAEEYEPDTDSQVHYFSFAGDGMTACKTGVARRSPKSKWRFWNGWAWPIEDKAILP